MSTPPDQAAPMSNPITACHKVPAIVVGDSDGTNHYECSVCHRSVNFDGSVQPDQAAQALHRQLYELMDSFLVEAKDQHGNERSLDRLNQDRHLFVANLLALMYQERITELKEVVAHSNNHNGVWLQRGSNFVNDRIKELEAAAKRYGQIRSEG